MTKRICQGWHAAGVRLIVTAGLCFSSGPFRSGADDSREQTRQAPPPPQTVPLNTADRARSINDPAEEELPIEQPPVGDATPSLDPAEIAATRTALNPLLIRDHRHRLLLGRGDESLRHGRRLEGLAHLQALLDAPHDAFYWPAASARPRGTQAAVVGKLQAMPAASRRDYDRLNGSEAQALLDQYRESRDRRLLSALVRRFGQTEVARTAAVHELLIARDAGHTRRAQEWARLLIADAYHWTRLPPSIQAVVSQQLEAGRGAAVTSESVSTSAQRQSVTHGDAQTSQRADTDPTPPFPIPLWSVDFLSGEHRRSGTPEDLARSSEVEAVVQSAFDAWLEDRIERRLPIASANEAVVTEDAVIVRDSLNVNAFDLLSGEVRWRYRCGSSLAGEAARQLDENRVASKPAPLDFDAHFSGNPVFGRLTTDGHRVYLLDRVPAADGQGGSADDRGDADVSSGTRYPNQLVAVAVRGEGAVTSTADNPRADARPLWTRGQRSSLPVDELAGQVFLGRPLCVDSRVFILAESDRQISLIALEAASGRTLWTQAVALSKRPIAADTLRARTACSPLYSLGIVVCPTEVGLVVGVDAITGRLQWVYDHFDDDQRTNSGRWAFNSASKTDRMPLPCHSFVYEGRVLHLPRTSEDLHCIDAATGAGVWKAPRLGAHAIAGVTRDSVLLLGDRECLAVALSDGQQQWDTIVPEPAGLGMILPHNYLLPTSDGFCLQINLASGRIEGRRFSRVLHELAGAAGKPRRGPSGAESAQADSDISRLLNVLETSPAGNLVPSGDVIVATTARGISVFAQAGPTLERLQEAAASRDLTAQERLTHAQLLLTVGNADRVAVVIEHLLRTSNTAEIDTPAERLLEEVLYAQLPRCSDPRPVLDRLQTLAKTDQQRARLLVSSIDAAIDTDDPQLLVASIQELQTLPSVFLESSEEDGYQVSAGQSVWEKLSTLQADDSSELREALQLELVARAAMLEHTTDPAELDKFVRQFAGWPAVASCRTQLAHNWIESGRCQEAELLLLSDRFSRDPIARFDTQRQLAALYVQQGLAAEAVHHLRLSDGPEEGPQPLPRSLVARFPVHALSVSMIGTSFVSVDPLPVTHGRFRTALAATSAAWEVDISEYRGDADAPSGKDRVCDRVRSLHRQSKAIRRIDPKLTGNLVVLDQGLLEEDRTCSRLVIGDRDSGIKRGEIVVPAAFWKIRHSLAEETGHVMVIGGESAVGLSLLEGKLLWTVHTESRRKKPEKIKVGPTGSDYCVLQLSDELRVVHPATGRTLWFRKRLPPGIGLEENELTGVIGDWRTLTVFDADQTTYTVYHTQSGRQLRRGALERGVGDHRRQQWGVGRRLVELRGTQNGARLTVWDSLADRVEWDIPLTDTLVCPLPNESHFAYVTSTGRLQILNVADGDLLVDATIPPTLSAVLTADDKLFGTRLVAFSDRDRFYVNLVDKSDSRDESTAATEKLHFPHVRVRGRLLAIDRADGEIVWDRPVADACIPLRTDLACPMLLLVRRTLEEPSHQRRRGSDGDSPTLMVEVLDAARGVTLAHRRDLGPSEFVECPITVQTNAEGEPQCIRMSLIGEEARVDVAYHASTRESPVRTAAKEGTTVER